MPLPGHHLIDPRFEAHHRPVVERAMPCTVRLTVPDTVGVRDPVTGRTVFGDPALLFEGHARLLAQSGGGATVAADRVLTPAAYALFVPATVSGVGVGVAVEVVTCPGNPDLPGLRLWVTDVPLNSVVWQRVFGCDTEAPVV